MKKFIIALALTALFCVNILKAQDKGAVFVFINPYKLFLGMVNIGAEYQINADHSVYMNADVAFFRTEHLKRINHPDIVITPGYRFYVPLDGKNGSRPFTGISASMTYAATNEDRPSAVHWGIGSELGYRWFPDETTTIAPRGIVNYNLSVKKFIFGAEVLAGKSFQ